MSLIQYIIIATVCVSISYLAFRLFLKKVTQFHHLRLFLISSLVLALSLPLMSVRLDYSHLFTKESTIVREIPLMSTASNQVNYANAEPGFFAVNRDLFIRLYFLIAITLIVRIVVQFIRLVRLYYISDKKESGRNVIIYTRSGKSPFSFFHWIFIPRELSLNEDTRAIIIHESIHASQYHSIDNLLIELVAAVMWFNPLVWMMKGSLHLVHEYLADEGALSTGIDRLRYQALLINQVTEERLICLSSSFNHSLIKKRMIMMTKSKNYPGRKLKILNLLPLSVILFLTVAFLNGLFPQEVQAQSNKAKAINSSDPKSSSVIVMQVDTAKTKVIIRTTADSKKKDGISEIKIIGYADNKLHDSLIYIVDGVQRKDINSINPDSIDAVDVRKSDNLIIVRTKSFNRKHDDRIVIESDVETLPDNVLYVIDGKESTKDQLDSQDASQIESINVVKGKAQIKALGYDEKYDGVILIKTKAKQ